MIKLFIFTSNDNRQTELDDMKCYYKFVIKITMSENERKAKGSRYIL